MVVRLRLVLRGVSPLIVRTIEVPAAIRAVGYSTDWAVDADDSRKVTLDSLGLRVGERFCWAYDFFAAGSSISGLKQSQLTRHRR